MEKDVPQGKAPRRLSEKQVMQLLPRSHPPVPRDPDSPTIQVYPLETFEDFGSDRGLRPSLMAAFHPFRTLAAHKRKGRRIAPTPFVVPLKRGLRPPSSPAPLSPGR